jgi:hypothetical protein
MNQPFHLFKITVTVPESHADRVRQAMGDAGAGRIGNYSHCSFTVKGIGRFKPEKGANPFIGHEGNLETVEEEFIEMNCSKEHLERVIEAIKRVHPYEEPVIDIYPIYTRSI